MPKPLVQDVVRAAKQLGEETVREIVKQPGEIVDTALEQLGGQPVVSKQPSASPTKPVNPQSTQIQQMKAADKVQSEQQAKRVLSELDQEIKKCRQIRQQQLQQRRKEPEPTEEEKAALETQQESLKVPAGKKPRGIFGRLQSAQQKAGAETGPARRTSG